MYLFVLKLGVQFLWRGPFISFSIIRCNKQQQPTQIKSMSWGGRGAFSTIEIGPGLLRTQEKKTWTL